MTPDIPDRVMEDAIGWFDDLRGAAVVDKEAFAAWLLRSPTHIEAFLSVAALHGGLSASTAGDSAWLEALIEDSRSNVQPLVDQGETRPPPSASSPDDSTTPRDWRGLGLVAVLVFAVTLGVAIGFWPSETSFEPQVYATELGEQRAVVLEDGSVMQLNTNSEVAVQFSATARDIALARGEAIFDVKKDPDRPFRVKSGPVIVEAIGTRFNVHHQRNETVVTVLEGRVSVEAGEPGTASPSVPATADTATASERGATASAVPASAVELGAGERLAIRRDGAGAGAGAGADVPVPVDTQRTTAWTQRRVVFDDDTLDTVVAEFNRYNRTKLIINDAALRARRISGIFTVDNPEVFVEVLASMTAVRTIEHDDGSLEIVTANWSADPIER